MELQTLSKRFLESDSEGQKKFLREEMNSEFSETLQGSLTNDLVETQVGTVLKKFSEKPLMAYIQAIGRIPSGNLDYQDIEKRIDNHRNFQKFASDYDIDMPDVIGREDEFVEFERIDGKNMYSYLNRDCSKVEARKMGTRIGDFVDFIHENEGALTDFRINNFILQYSGDLAFVDAEYFSENATEWEKEMDLITMVSSLKQVDPDSYTSFMEGFRNEYNGEIDCYAEAASSATSLIHASILERDFSRLKNSSSNALLEIRNYVNR
ncbi:MAG: hypothetical protein ABEJ36_02200 [Candidatus Nanosalina sp.]